GRQAGDLQSSRRYACDQVGWKYRIGLDRPADAERLEAPEDIRPELDAGADLAEFGGLLQQDETDALERKGQCRRKPADTPAHDDDRTICHLCLPARLCRPLIDPFADYIG